MPPEYDENDVDDAADQGDGEQQGGVPREHIRQLEKDAKEGKAAKRALAFYKAGVDPDDPKYKYFMKGYDGELSADAIRAEAIEVGLLTEDGGSGGPEITDEEREADDVASDAARGAPSDERPEPNPKDRAQTAFDNAMESGATREDAIGAAVATMGQAAVAGDHRAIWTPPSISVE